MPRKRARSPPVRGAGEAATHDKRSDVDDDDFAFDDMQSLSGRSSQEPVHRNAANARERARMRVLSKAFCRLKTTLPWVPADTKLSKLDTLRLAASYIAHLRGLLRDEPHVSPHPLSLAWPFAFQHGAPATATSRSPLSGWSPPESNSSTPLTNITSRENIGSEIEKSHRGNTENENYNCHQNVNLMSSFVTNEMAANDTNCNSTVQYCNNNYVYRDNYYELRNAYSDSILNNIQ